MLLFQLPICILRPNHVCFCKVHIAATVLDLLARTATFILAVTRLAKRQQSVRELPSSLITAFTFNDTSTNVIFSSDFEEQRPKQSRQQTYQTGIVIYIIQVGEMGLRWQGAFRVELVNHLLKTFTPSTMESSLMSLTSV